MELDLKGVAFYLKDIMNQSIMSSVALSIAFSCKNIYACMLLMHLCNALTQSIELIEWFKYVIQLPNSNTLFNYVIQMRNFRSSALDTAPLLILGNKQDIDGCLPLLEIKHAFHDCSNRIGSRDCMIRPCSALTGAGVTEGIEWMAKCVKLNPYRPPRQDGR